MDPDRVLLVLRAGLRMYDQAVAEWETANEEQDDAPSVKDAERYSEALEQVADVMANGFRDLDEWLSRGSFLPRAWRPDRASRPPGFRECSCDPVRGHTPPCLLARRIRV